MYSNSNCHVQTSTQLLFVIAIASNTMPCMILTIEVITMSFNFQINCNIITWQRLAVKVTNQRNQHKCASQTLPVLYMEYIKQGKYE